MEHIIKTTVGHALKQLFTDNIAFTIAAFLVEDPEEKEEDYKAMCATLYGKTMKGKKEKFDRYCKNLRYDSFFVYSYDTAVVKFKLETPNRPEIRQVEQNNKHTHELCNSYVRNVL